MNALILKCEYCGHQGVYPEVIHINEYDRWACVDVSACDERDAAANPETDDETA